MKHSVLIIEDDRVIRKLLEGALAAGGFSIEAADTGSRAVEIIRRLGPGLSAVVMDINLADMSGLEVIRRTRSLIAGALIIITSGLAVEPAPAELEGLRAAFIKKPYNVDEIIAAIRKHPG